MRPRRCKKARMRRGGVLFEILLSIALFAGAAAFALGSLRSAFVSIDHSRRHQQAIDIARSKLAELEAGLINLADLRGASASAEWGEAAGQPVSARNDGWIFDVKTQRTEFANLSLVELTVRENLPPAEEANAVQYTLRQLMPLRSSLPGEFEADEISGAGET
jgi:hypothetical protein